LPSKWHIKCSDASEPFYGQKISFEKLRYHSLMSNVEIKASIKTARELLDKEKNLSPAFRAAMSVMFMAVPFC